ncbi:MAG: 2-hydroxy-3-oxopropionate reductase [Chitinophagaceae bacterium]|jgi:2-hydroxy-3-oxopropionate reductase
MQSIGFIGLGIMGRPMAMHLLKAGHTLHVYEGNRAAGDLKAAGATGFSDYASLAAASDVVITMLPDSPDVEAVVLGPGGVAEGIRSGSLFIDMSSIAPATARKVHEALAARGVEALDAPVSGGQVGAEAATLSIMVGGSQEAFDRAMPLFSLMGKNIVRIGGAGAGQTTKICNQMIVGMTIQAVGEAFTLGRKAGVDLQKMREVLLGGFASSRILDLHGQRIIDGNFKPGFKVKLHRKDMNLALQSGRELSVPMPGAALVASQMDALMATGEAESDHSALALLMERLSGL